MGDMGLPTGETKAYSKESHNAAQMCKLAEKAETALQRGTVVELLDGDCPPGQLG